MVVTIVVLLILAGISISLVVGDNGLVSRAERAKELHEEGERNEQVAMNVYEDYIAKINSLDPNTLPKGPNGKPLVTEVTTTEHETIIGEDAKGNQVVIPGGFQIAEDSGSTVQEGIVVEDSEGNQFVWIPVSNINHDGSNKIKLDDNSEVEITLGRYTFDATTGEETIQQLAIDYTEIVIVEDYYQELSSFREGIDGTNATAKNLKGFVESVEKNKGYYIARYEASFGSGTASETITNQKPYSKESIANCGAYGHEMKYMPGTLWGCISQPEASKVSRNMYEGNYYVESDLLNSYSWDTAIVYIQKMGNSNYANANCNTTGNKSLLNTGTTGDVKCNIYDMSANLFEWTTEYSTFASESYGVCSGVERGSNCLNAYSTSRRIHSMPLTYGGDTGFRPIIYCI